MIAVLDASAAIELVLQRPHGDALAKIVGDAEWVLVPGVFAAEVTNTMWKYHRFNHLPAELCETAVGDALALPDTYADDRDMAREAFALASLVGRPVYDALYLALTRRHDATLLTLDRRLRDVACGQSIRAVSLE